MAVFEDIPVTPTLTLNRGMILHRLAEEVDAYRTDRASSQEHT